MIEELPKIVALLKNMHPFRKMQEPQIIMFAEHMKTVTFDQNDIVFKQEELADGLYIVYQGNVQLSYWDGEQDISLGKLERGDVFGFEVWDEEQGRFSTVKALDHVTLLRLDLEDLYKLAEENLAFDRYLEVMIKSFYLSLEKNMSWRDDDEAIVCMERVHPLFLGVMTLPSLAVFFFFLVDMFLYFTIFGKAPVFLGIGLFLLLIAIGWGVWAYIDWANDYHIITSNRVLNLQKVVLLYDSRQEAPLDAVLSVGIETSQWGRWFHFGDVNVKTFTGSILLHRVPQPEEFVSLLQERMARASTGKMLMEKRAREKAVLDKLGIAPPAQKGGNDGKQPKEAEIQPGWLQEFLANMFQMRVEQGNKVVYHTHWVKLIKKTWLSSLTILAVPVFIVLNLIGTVMIFSLAFGVVVSILVLLGMIGWWIYEYLDWRNDRYILTDEQLIDINKKPLGKEDSRTASLKNIQSIQYKRLGFIGLLLNYGTVYIRIGDDEFTFDFVYDPGAVQREIFRRLAQKKYKDKQAEMESDRRMILDWIEAYHNAVGRHK